MNFRRVLQRSSQQFCLLCQNRSYAVNANAALPVDGRNVADKHKKTTAPTGSLLVLS